MLDVSMKIQQYKTKFSELKIAFQNRTVLQTGITVSRIMNNLDDLSKFVNFSMQQRLGSYCN